MTYSFEKKNKRKNNMKEKTAKENGQSLSGPRKVVLCGKVSKSLSEQIRQLVKSGKYETLNDFVEAAILEKVERETEAGGMNFDE